MLHNIFKSTILKTTAFVALGAAAALPSHGQTDASDSPPSALTTATGDDTAESKPALLPAAEQKKLVQTIYETTKTARSAKQLSSMIEKCNAASQAGLSQKHINYVRTLKAWALNRRGESRLEVAKQLKAIGNVAQYQKAFDEAIGDFNDSLSIDTTRHRTFNSRGIAYLVDGQLVSAAKDFTKAVGKRADFTAGYFNRAEALSSMKKWKLAIKDYETVLSLEPDDAQAITGRAHANLELGNLDLALKDYDRVVLEFSDNAIALINRGDCHQKASHWKACMDDYRSAEKLGSKDLADQRIAWVLATSGDDTVRDAKQALAIIEPCVRQSAEPTVAMLETLAAAQAAVGRFDDAKESQSKVIRLTSGSIKSDSNSKPETADGKSQAKSASAAQLRLALYEDNQPYLQNKK